MYWWYYVHGFRELRLRRNPGEDDLGPAQEPVVGLTQRGFVPITCLMRTLWHWHLAAQPASRRTLTDRIARRLFGVDYPLRGRHAQEQLLAWFFAKGLSDANLDGFLTVAQADALLANVDGAPRVFSLIWQAEPALAQRFDGRTQEAFHIWCKAEGAKDFPILAHPLIGIANRKAVAVPRVASPPFGVNLIGDIHGRSGISEDVRMVAAALKVNHVPFAVIDVVQGASDNNSREMPYLVSLFCMTGQDMLASTQGDGQPLLRAPHNIGYWPWELERWPDLLASAFEIVDEIWAASRFSTQAYQSATDMPVRHMPMAVNVDETDGLSRADFDLPQGSFIFVFAFDGLSTFARKNPQAVIEAFATAFPNGDEPVFLVLKGLRTEGQRAWSDLRARAACDQRIRLVPGSLTRGALLDLYRAANCFVSLHRSEGFGRNIAECMALGKPVIATAYSGNLDFTVDGCVALVPTSMCPVEAGQYPFGVGQVWAQPDIAVAAQHMKRLVLDRDWRHLLSRNARALMKQHHGPITIGATYRARLEAIAGDAP